MDRVGPAEDGRRQLAERLDGHDRASASASFVVLYVALLIVDFVLMRRYARVDPPEVGGEGDEFALPAVDVLMDLETFWFCLIVVFWACYFLLEGFDFGVGHAAAVRAARRTRSASTMLRTIGPVWDGNEVWLVVAGGATFAAFPAWYATMFSGFYLALLLILVFLIVRVVSFEWRAKSETPGLAGVWTWANTIGSFGAPLLWGIGLSSLALRRADRLGRRLHRQPPGSLQPVHACSPGSRSWLLFAFHGATFLTLRTTGELREPRRGGRATARDPGRRRSAPRTSSGPSWSPMDRNDKDLFPPAAARRARDRRARCSPSSSSLAGAAAGRSR